MSPSFKLWFSSGFSNSETRKKRRRWKWKRKKENPHKFGTVSRSRCIQLKNSIAIICKLSKLLTRFCLVLNNENKKKTKIYIPFDDISIHCQWGLKTEQNIFHTFNINKYSQCIFIPHAHMPSHLRKQKKFHFYNILQKHIFSCGKSEFEITSIKSGWKSFFNFSSFRSFLWNQKKKKQTKNQLLTRNTIAQNNSSEWR